MPSYHLVTFGCQMNQHDSDRIGEVLHRAGYEPRDRPEDADLVLLNTCSVREKAEQKLRSEVGRLALLKRSRPDLVIAVAGCVAQQEGERLLRRMPEIDLIVGPDRILDLPEALSEIETGGLPAVRTGFDVDAPRFLEARPEPNGVRPSAFVTVMKGCNERCSFCIVPYTRGPERYRPAAAIVDEVERLVSLGVREVTLLGQTVNSYRDPERSLEGSPEEGEPWQHTRKERARDDESEFSALLRRIVARVPGLQRLRYTSPHPRHLTRSLIRAHAELAPLARHVHLPVQSGSDRVLRRMIRRYSVAEYVERVEALRRAVPGITISTDVIVGFPGETESDFEATLALVRQVEFCGLFGFKYSPRPFTPALRLGDDVPEEEKSERLARLFEVAEQLKREQLNRRVGSIESVLVEGTGKRGEFTGRTERNEIVHFESPRVDPTGHIVPVRIEQAFNNSLFGVLVDERGLPPRSTPKPNEERPRRGLPLVAG
ncbi:MAG TPA: tRNA (N6-isopentenyl adenosine(37)-C2)-methylthiotransferase MiaB [Polyangiaceae bacterium]|nr:MAG: tRNA (N6-isopentenyl adenosine(37)-C2)-methylthiotransferase MiaB [Pseudomonadota bacterium]HLV66858.1 tRNA (N6-isopentenyl adenosine(37)-C2)-methylthiotransferase MiaB [Polyangiaceae bacterium]